MSAIGTQRMLGDRNSGHLHAELDRLYGTFDTILVGHTTYEEMVEYWPDAETAEAGSEISRSRLRR